MVPSYSLLLREGSLGGWDGYPRAARYSGLLQCRSTAANAELAGARGGTRVLTAGGQRRAGGRYALICAIIRRPGSSGSSCPLQSTGFICKRVDGPTDHPRGTAAVRLSRSIVCAGVTRLPAEGSNAQAATVRAHTCITGARTLVALGASAALSSVVLLAPSAKAAAGADALERTTAVALSQSDANSAAAPELRPKAGLSVRGAKWERA